MFEREHHRNVALVLQALDPQVLAARQCWFGGGTAMALRYGEYRESVDIDFLVADRDGYRELRQMLGGVAGLAPLLRPGLQVELAREVRADQYGIRTQVRSGAASIKFEIVFEARITLDAPGPTDQVCGVRTLAAVDLAAEKLLANTDRWPDDSVFSRDLIDLAMMTPSRSLFGHALAKAEAAYGPSVVRDLKRAIERLADRKGRLHECVEAMSMNAPPALVWEKIKRLRQFAAAKP